MGRQLLPCILLFFVYAIIVAASGSGDSSSDTVAPIIVRGNKLYNSKTKERFFMKGLTYGYAVSDDYYDEYAKEVFTERLKDLEFNTVRLYNINPDNTYDKFMADMKKRGIYVLIAASPGSTEYFGKYRYSTITKKLGPNGAVSGSGSAPEGNTCYPALLLQFGKKIAKTFAQYDNTLGIVVANEIMQKDLTAAACVKQYTADLKTWMAVNGDRLRMLPLAFAAADSSYGDKITDADEYHVLKIQGLLCGDEMKDGMMQESIDMYLINEYRWCPDSDFDGTYKRFMDSLEGVPIVLAFGEYGCNHDASSPRTWGMVEYMYGDSSDTKGFSNVWSGGLAYSYGEAGLSDESLFPMFKDGSTDALKQPSTKKTKDFDNLKKQFEKYAIVSEKADWKKDSVCTWTPKNDSNVTSNSKRVKKHGWLVDDCDADFLKVVKTDTWTMKSREGVVCNDDGGKCDVSLSKTKGTTQEDLCGDSFELKEGGGDCEDDNDCNNNGRCKKNDKGDKECKCNECYVGKDCSVKDVSTCDTLASSKTAPTVVYTMGGLAIAALIVGCTALGIYAQRKYSASKQKTDQAKLGSGASAETAAT